MTNRGGRDQLKLKRPKDTPCCHSLWCRRWQWVFPQENRWQNSTTGEEGRHDIHETRLQKAVKFRS
ncbi:MAG: hypothetical protein JW902_04950 [Syntrophaceae bacterium]|nr:hypothetical protein [Syntrophaceae bacterium]